MTTTTIKVSKHTRERLAQVAHAHGKTMDQALNVLLTEHEQTVQAHLATLAADEARMAELERRRREPLSESIPQSQVLDMFADQDVFADQDAADA